MKKEARFEIIAFTLLLVGSAALIAACADTDKRGKNAGDPHDLTMQDALIHYMPDQMTDNSVKVAVIRNLPSGDHTRQFLEGCISEGWTLGFTVDTFITDGDNARCQSLISRIGEADYDGVILSHGEAEYTYDALKPLVQKGIKAVTFDSLPCKNGDPREEILQGVTSTAQEDAKLADLSLKSILDQFPPSRQPLRVIRVWIGPGIPPLDRRQTVYDQFVKDKKIEETTLIRSPNIVSARSKTREALSTVLSYYPEGTVDAIWAPYDEFAKGCIDALKVAGRTDIKLTSIDISNDDIALMAENSRVWVSTAAVDPKLIGVVTVRLLAAKFAGEPTPAEYNFDAQLVIASNLGKHISMSNIDEVIPGWGQREGLFDSYPWMHELKIRRGNRQQFASEGGISQE